MQVRSIARWTQKAGNTPDEYEDAWACAPESGTVPFRAAVADGATETSFSGLWADLLAQAYGAGAITRRRWSRCLDPLQELWWRDVGARPLPWYAEEKRAAGAYAALAGVTIRRLSGEMRWSAMAVGDSCLLHCRGDAVLTSFPIGSAAEFGRSPALISSRPAANAAIRPRYRTGPFIPGDRLILATDALAAALLSASAADQLESAVDALAADFEVCVREMRADGSLRNDDVTMLVLTLE